jgi:hypothetical protein
MQSEGGNNNNNRGTSNSSPTNIKSEGARSNTPCDRKEGKEGGKGARSPSPLGDGALSPIPRSPQQGGESFFILIKGQRHENIHRTI